MSTLRYPLRFQPFLRPMPWGGKALTRFLGKNPGRLEPIGESWEVSDHASHASVLANGSLAGSTLRELMVSHRDELLGPAAAKHSRFPWLIKLLDANDWLSVQVHPDENDVARWLPGEGPKTECWLILDVKPTGRVFAGLKEGVQRADVQTALQQGKIIDLLHQFTPRPGDLVHLPAGTIHAVGGGVLFAEIQQTSDATFRLYDWDRVDAAGQRRALHLEAGLACLHWPQPPVTPVAANGRAAGPVVRCPYYSLTRWQAERSPSLGGTGRLQALIVTRGQGRWQTDNGDFLMEGDIWLFPAAMPATTLAVETPLAGLLCDLP